MNRKLLTELARSPFNALNRRDFVKYAGGCAGLSSISLLSTILNLRLTASLMADENSGDYKALVCLFFFGGNDSFQLLSPYEDLEYDNGTTGGFVNIRKGVYNPDDSNSDGVALWREKDLNAGDLRLGESTKPITCTLPGGGTRQYGIHGYFNAAKNEPRTNGVVTTPFDTSLPENDVMRTMYNNGELCFVSNVGTLIRPTTIADYRAGRYRPLGIFSHSDEQRNWMTSLPQTRAQNIGYLGRASDVLRSSCNLNAKIGMNIALNSINIAQTGQFSLPYVVTSGGAFLLEGYPTTANNRNAVITQATDNLLAQTYASLLESTNSADRRNAIDAAIEYNGATQGVTLLNETGWSNGGLEGQLKQVAKAILAHGDTSPNNSPGLKQERQIFFVSLGGFDNHSNLIGNHRNTMPNIGRSVSLFAKEMREQGLLDNVTLFTASDFSRTLDANSNVGSDHAWGANQFVVGGTQVNGGNVHGNALYPGSNPFPMPDMTVKGSTGTSGTFLGDWSTDSRGRLLPSVSVDEYMHGILRWFGVPASEMATVLPNLSNFTNPAGAPTIPVMT